MRILFLSLRPYLLRYKWFWISGTVFIVISNLFLIYPAQVVRDAFDLVADLVRFYGLMQGFKTSDVVYSLISQGLLLFGGIVVILALLRGIFLFLVRQTLIVMSRLIEFDQKAELFNTYQGYSLSMLRQRQTGDLMARISEDVSNVRMFTGPGIMYSINTFTLFVMILVTMLYVNAELTLYVLTPLPLLSLSVYYVHSIIIKRSEAQQQQLSTLTSLVQEVFSGIRLVKAYVRESAMAQKYQEQSDTMRDKALALTRVDAMFYPLIGLLIGLSTAFTVWIGGEKVIAGTLTIGNIAEFVLYVNMLIWPVTALGWVTSLTQKAASSQIRINEMLGLRSELKYPNASEPVVDTTIKFENVSFTYTDTGITGLDNVSFEIKPGSLVGVVGLTGAGKTTLINLLLRLYDADTGQVYLGGKPIQSYTNEHLRKAMAVVPQDAFLFSDTIAANIAFGKADASNQEIIQAAQFAGVYDDVMSFPNGFETIIGERGVTLSGGQKQRLCIARAYLTKAPIFILDDSLSAIDTKTELIILNNLRGLDDLGYKPTLILITHRLSAIQHADTILVIQSGKLVEQGTHAQLYEKTNGFYRTYYERQQLEQQIQQV